MNSVKTWWHYMNQQVIVQNHDAGPSKAQQIKEYQELLEMGSITQEEFDKIKEKILFE